MVNKFLKLDSNADFQESQVAYTDLSGNPVVKWTNSAQTVAFTANGSSYTYYECSGSTAYYRQEATLQTNPEDGTTYRFKNTGTGTLRINTSTTTEYLDGVSNKTYIDLRPGSSVDITGMTYWELN